MKTDTIYKRAHNDMLDMLSALAEGDPLQSTTTCAEPFQAADNGAGDPQPRAHQRPVVGARGHACVDVPPGQDASDNNTHQTTGDHGREPLLRLVSSIIPQFYNWASVQYD